MRVTVGRLAPLALAMACCPGPLATGAGPAGPEGITMERVAYGGWSDNLRISNGQAELIVTLEVGPRIISYRLKDGPNVLKEFADQMGKSGESRWQVRGGHRLWAGPEDLTRTYAPDNRPVRATTPRPGVALVTQEPDEPYGIQKAMEIALEPTGSGVTITHTITNVGSEPTELCPWGLTVMAPGGVEIVPMPPRKPHPGPPENAKSPADYAADRLLVLWPYFDFTDPRWTFGRDVILLRQDSRRGPTKIGLAQTEGWAAYLREGQLFVKRFAYQPGQPYPDRGCNFETFSNEEMLEVESLGPMVRLEPGQAATHVERWELHGGVEDVRTEADALRVVVPRVRGGR